MGFGNVSLVGLPGSLARPERVPVDHQEQESLLTSMLGDMKCLSPGNHEKAVWMVDDMAAWLGGAPAALSMALVMGALFLMMAAVLMMVFLLPR